MGVILSQKVIFMAKYFFSAKIRDPLTGKFIPKRGSPEEINKRKKLALRRSFMRGVDSVMDKTVKVSLENNANYFIIIKKDDEVHFSGSPGFVDSFKTTNPLLQYAPSMLETKRECVVSRLSKAGRLKTVVLPPPSVGPNQLSFLPTQNVDLGHSQRQCLKNLQINIPESGITLDPENVNNLKKRIFARKRRANARKRLDANVEKEGAKKSRRGRPRLHH